MSRFGAVSLCIVAIAGCSGSADQPEPKPSQESIQKTGKTQKPAASETAKQEAFAEKMETKKTRESAAASARTGSPVVAEKTKPSNPLANFFRGLDRNIKFGPVDEPGPKVGDVVPEIVGVDIDGVEFQLSDYRGKVVVLDFWGDW